ncbi:BCCT family transporter [Stakelama sp. CBK3Z-3]|uniref:BCCT family transporter n=1 Tax=Stakelama flava TaxID=2860338 RepID=A0ABS6XHE7_9SPHN|nr:BCCT family transporter [Stakelama flava]MBW4329633.1 BCCT family transporter [Stakelama flava]
MRRPVGGTQQGASMDEAKSQSRTNNAIDPVVFFVSFGIIVIFCVAGAAFPEQVDNRATAALDWVMRDFGWVFILSATGFLGFIILLALGPWGKIRLGKDDERPEFSTLSWIAMMFSAGMGIGLMFYGVYEPVTHFASPPPGWGLTAQTPDAGRMAMAYTLFHWGLHPWGIYGLFALALAYSTFRKGRGNLISGPFQSLLGKHRIEQRGWGKPIDIWAIVATKFGGATSLGLGALQIAGGLGMYLGLRDKAAAAASMGESTTGIELALGVIAILSVFAIISALSGVSKGIKWLSNANMVMAVVLLFFVLVLGSTVFLFDLIPSSIGAYLSNFVAMSFHSSAFGGDEWMGKWTIFFWAWWISWTPFVSTFIARISRGRTIRQFVFGVLVIPTLVSAIWFVIFGGAAIDMQMHGVADIASAGAPENAFFAALKPFPFPVVTGIMVMALTGIFWVSGADASALVLATLSSRGAVEPKKWLVALWAIASAAVAAILLVMGGLEALQTFTVLVACPFVLIMIALCWALFRDLREDARAHHLSDADDRDI